LKIWYFRPDPCRYVGSWSLRIEDVDFAKHVIRIRQSVDAATRSIQAVKSQASSADVPMPSQLETRLRALLRKHDGKSELLFVNRRGRPFYGHVVGEQQRDAVQNRSARLVN
jgi:integrase